MTTTTAPTKRLTYATMIAAIVAAGIAIQSAHAADVQPLRVIQLPTVTVIAKRLPVVELERVVVTAKRAPAVTLIAQRNARHAAPV